MPPAHNPWNPTLYFWDVPAAILGFIIALALSTVHVAGIEYVFWCAPAVLVAMRRAALPRLTPSDDAKVPAPSIGRRIGAYACLVVGGFIALISGTIFYFVATDAKEPAFAWPLLLAFALGGAVVTLGLRVLVK